VGWLLSLVILCSLNISEVRTPASAEVCTVNTTEQTEIPAEDGGSVCKGWPVNLGAPGAGFPYTPTLFDTDQDGTDEIFLTGGETFGINGDGSFLPGWPTSDMAYMGYATNTQMPGPSCADINNDGITEIMWSERDWYAGSAYMWTFNGRLENGTDLSGFPQAAPDESSNALNSPFVLGDANGDGFLEAASAHTLGNTGDYYRISAFDHTGSVIYTTDLDPSESILNIYFGDADGNGSEEFFAVTLFSDQFRLHLLDSSGDEQAGYPVNLCSIGGGYLMFGPPLAADLDEDGDIEIILGYTSSSIAYAAGVHHDGTIVSGFPITVATGSQLFYLGLGDITGDGKPELLGFDNQLSSNYRAWAIDLITGSPLSGWPVSLPNWPKGFPTVVDVNNTGIQDVCFVTDGGLVYALSSLGTILTGYPKTMSTASVSGVAAGDIDGDGLYELVAATWDGWVYAWDTEGVVTDYNASWPMRGVDPRNTGIYTGAAPSGITELPQPVSLTISSNPAHGSAAFSITGDPAGVTLRIYDITGKLVSHAAWSGSAFVWQPTETTAPGVYFARAYGTESDTVKFLLTR